jgi:hypothetical protein
MRALERALDLVWARDAAAHLGVELSGAELLRLDAELDALAHELLPSCARGDDRGKALIKLDRELWSLSADDLDALRSRGDRPAEVEGRLPTLCALVDAGHLSGGPWIEVPVGGAGGCEVGLIERLSTALARELASQQVVVEVNPSSNLLVAGLHAPLAQERLWTRGLSPDQTGAVPICLSADDPMVFATALEDEVAYAWAGMVVAGGLSATYARGWIEDALGVAWRARFTLPSA